MESERPRAPGDGHPEEWRPRQSMGGRIAVAAAILAAVCSGAAWAYALSRPIALDSLVAALAGLAACLLAALLAVFARGYYSLRYRLSYRKLVVSWLWMRETVPLGRIEAVYRGHRLGKMGGVGGIAWLGYFVGSATSENFRRVKYYGTSLNPDQVVVVTISDCAYALTPSDLDGFRHALIARLEELPEEDPEQSPPVTTTMARLQRLSLLRDGVALALLAGGLVVLLALGIHQRIPSWAGVDARDGRSVTEPSAASAPSPPVVASHPSSTPGMAVPGSPASKPTVTSIGASANPTATPNAAANPTAMPIPSATTLPRPSATPEVKAHVVQAGDTLWMIAAANGVTVDDLMRANGLVDRGRLEVGQRLVIPTPTPRPSPTP